MTRAFGLDFDAATVAALAAHGERDYPTEACGVVVGRPGAAELLRVEPLKNAQDRYHQRDPARFTRSGRDAFRVDELERMRLLERLEAEGLVERVLYHSHCEAGAYFSPEDRAMAVVDGVELLPDVVHVVVSVMGGRAVAAAAFRYDPARARFDEVRIALHPASVDAPKPDVSWPDLEGRAMEGKASSRPIRPAGGRLIRRLVSEDEARQVAARAVAQVEVGVEVHDELRRLALGLWSPVTGFGARAWPAGWSFGPEAGVARPAGAGEGTVVTLVRGGLPLAAVRLDAGEALSGEVVVYPSALAELDAGADAADVRAELVRRGASRVRVDLALTPRLATDRGVVPLSPVTAHSDPRARALFAQNLGATEIAPHDAAVDAWVRRHLDLAVGLVDPPV